MTPIVKVRVKAGCFHDRALVDRLNAEVVPITSCRGLTVECSKGILMVTAWCRTPIDKGEFRQLIRAATWRRPLLSGRKRRR